MNEAFAGLVIARCAHEAGGGRQFVAGAQGVAAASLDLLAHPCPFLKPSGVVAHLVRERTADPVDLIDFDAGPRRCGQADQKSHRPAVIARKIEEGGIVPFVVRHACSVAIIRRQSVRREKT
jgi:hypothetical protein